MRAISGQPLAENIGRRLQPEWRTDDSRHDGRSALSRLPDFDVIVVNDGSTDDTAKIAAEYTCRRYQY